MQYTSPPELWRIEAKQMICPFSCHFNFMIRGYKFPLSNNEFGPTVSRSRSKRSTTYLRAALMHERVHPFHLSVSASSKDSEDIAAHNRGEFILDVVTVNSRYQPVEEPWLLQLDVSPHTPEKSTNAHIDSIDGNGTPKFMSICSESESSPKRFISDTEDQNVNHQANFDATPNWCLPGREYPVEDPWLLYSLIEPLDISEPTVDVDVRSPVDIQEQRHKASEKLTSKRESDIVTQGDSVSTEILINCSVCTMQRIAVLEDGNLVELLLEPVNCNVQCDSVYLGVFTKRVPHMGGAFVHIGSSRPSLMDINFKRDPFIFPPFDTAKGTDLKNSSSCVIEQAIVEQDDARLSDDDLDGDFEDDDFDEHELEHGIDLGNRLCANGNHPKVQLDPRLSQTEGHKTNRRIQGADEMWARVRKGTKIVVQVVKEGLGRKGPTLTPYPKLRSRFWVLITHCNTIGVSKKISGVERGRLRGIAKSLQPPGFGVTVRTVAAGHSADELRKDLEGLLSTWRTIMDHAKSAALAADEGVADAVPVILHQAMGQTLSVVQDYFNEKVKRMVVDSPRTYHEVTNYLQSIAPDLCERVELHRNKVPLFDEFNIEEEINNIINKRVALPNGGSLVIEQTEALVSIDVNGGHGMFGQGVSQEKAILDVNLAAAKQIARELRLRDIGGIIVVDFIDMMNDSNKRLIYEQVSKAVERDRSIVKVSELSKHGLMEITRKRVRPSVTFMISEPCTCCHGTGRVEALETSFSKIEHEICSLLATLDRQADPGSPKSWPRLLLRVDTHMCDYLTSGKKTKLATLSSSLKVWILLKVARNLTRGAFELKLLADEKGNNSHHQVGTAMLLSEADTSKSSKRTKLFTVKKWKSGSK